MSDPYKVLDVQPGATDDEIKSAYRELARKYHPDNYQNNPLAELATEKMKEINEAYDEIMRMRREGNNGSRSYTSGSTGGWRAGSSAGTSEYADIRRLINARRISEADELLEGIPVARRSAEWYFLKGSVYYSRGWLDEAYRHFSQAVSMYPGNGEYRAALDQLDFQRTTGQYQAGPYRTTGAPQSCSSCDLCSSLICADCCCECMGGDLISCC